MRDRYIDDVEMKSYGDGFVEAAKAKKTLSPFLATLSKSVERETRAVVEASGKTGTARVDVKSGVKTKAEALAEANDVLSHVAMVVKAHQGRGVDATAFFPQGKRTAVGHSEAKVAAALEKCAKGFARYSKVIPGSAAEKAEVERKLQSLKKSMATTSAGRADASAASPKLVRARARWHAAYKAAKLGTHAVLLLRNLEAKPEAVEKELKGFFKDLSGGKAPKARQPKGASGTSGTTPPAP